MRPARTSDKARYLHFGIKEHGKHLEIEDIFIWLDQLFAQINLFLGQVFGFLRNTLSDTPVIQICGMVQGRMLMRKVVPTQPLQFVERRLHVMDVVRET